MTDSATLLQLAARRFRLRIVAGRAKSDPEKLVTPGILYASRRGKSVSARLLAFGWWDWHVSFVFAALRARASQEDGNG